MRATEVPLLLAACLVLGAAVHATHAGSDSDIDPLVIEPVAPSRTLLAADASGYGNNGAGYGSYSGASQPRRRLISGGSGGYGENGGQGGYGTATVTPRQLREEDVQLEPTDAALEAAKQQQLQEQERLASASAAAQRRAQQQREAAAASEREEKEKQKALQQHQQAAVTSDEKQQAEPVVTAAMAAAMRGARAATASSLMSAPAGQCYCKYDTDYNTWALGEAPCKDALRTKCKAGQLPCEWLDQYYGHAAGSTMAHTLPHEQDILGFVFDDCQPHPPCACAGIKFDGSDPVTSSYACCRDLRAACHTPFNGLSCSDVEAFCKDDQNSTKLLHWAQHKLHRGAECASYSGTPYKFTPLEAIIKANKAASDPSKADDQIAQSEGVSMAFAAPRWDMRGNRVALVVVGLGGLLVIVALAGMVMTLRAGQDEQAAVVVEAAHEGTLHAPLLHPVPELAVRGGASVRVRHVISSNYLLASGPPSRADSAASMASSVHQQQ